ncbi:H-NS histone family protein [Caballeronia humi]|uniref:Histone family protein nucleoid-structuring protein H-NS n=1 Tax=Caballeronia humi TaxID=326474 RepID=A0A158IH86_9BURK|nr:H-NS histone family protein [Caballeronia humi]SAL55837.1 histone family protein nucleoid-structuring protein H-NS [Caballeronia humi]
MATLAQLKQRIAKLQKQAETIAAKAAKSVLNDIRAIMDEHGLTTADIDAHRSGRKTARKATPPKAAKKVAKSSKASKTTSSTGKLPAKYINPKTGETWSGHARPPAWIKDVKDRTKFLIDGAAAQPVVASKKVTARKSRSVNGIASTKATASRKSAGKTATSTSKSAQPAKPVTRRARAKPASNGAAQLASADGASPAAVVA